jgi:putative DNA primase/helicase
MPNDQLTIAQWLVHQRGFSVIAVDHPDATSFSDEPTKIGKVPSSPWKLFQIAPPTDDNLVSWFGNGTPRNPAIVTGLVSNIVVVDGDSPAALAWMTAHLPATDMRTRTAKGEHWYFRHPGVPIRNKARIRTDEGQLQLDVRADGGFVVAPTAKHASGVTYERLGTWPPVDQLPVFDLGWIVANAPNDEAQAGRTFVATDRDQLLRHARAYVAAVPPAVTGNGGDSHTFRLACKLVRGFALSDSDALTLLREWNHTCQPPWTDRELDEKIQSAHKYGTEPIGGRAVVQPRAVDTSSRTFPLTDSGNAEYFAERWGHLTRFDCARREWFVFTDHRWTPNRTGEVDRLALEAIRQRQADALALTDDKLRKAALKWTCDSENSARRDHTMKCAATVEELAVDGSAWDTPPLLFGVRNGVIDLETGVLREGIPEDGITKQAPVLYDAAATCPRFERFLREIFASTPDLVAYMQRVLGYALTGLVSEQVFWILWGLGANGKSTLIELFLQHVLGPLDYAWAMPFPTADWSTTMSEYQKASLVGRRFVTASEVTRRGHLNEELIKSLTGDDTLNARHPYGRPFQFQPCAKFFLRVNEKPVIRDESHGMWRRVQLVPFTQTFPVDTTLAVSLAAEASGILAWAVRGCLDWQREGLCEPAVVQDATAEYKAESDLLAGFVADRCVIDESGRIGGRELYAAYRTWCDAQHTPDDERLTQKTFGLKVKQRFPDMGTPRKVLYAGVRLRDPSELFE